MEVRFRLCAGAAQNGSSVPLLEQLIERTRRPLEMLVLSWVSSERSLHISGREHQGEGLLFIGLEEGARHVAFTTVAVSELQRMYGRFPELKEEVFLSTDHPGYVPDLRWFEKRNQQMGIRWSEELSEYRLPARSLAKLVLSYALSSAGMVQVAKEMFLDRRFRFHHAYRLTFAFLGEDLQTGWKEEYVIAQDALHQYASRRSRGTSPVLRGPNKTDSAAVPEKASGEECQVRKRQPPNVP